MSNNAIDMPDDNVSFSEIARGHLVKVCWIKGGDDELAIRIERPHGTGRPLFETIVLNAAEAEALGEVLFDEFK